jgi:hypothetical protein
MRRDASPSVAASTKLEALSRVSRSRAVRWPESFRGGCSFGAFAHSVRIGLSRSPARHRIAPAAEDILALLDLLHRVNRAKRAGLGENAFALPSEAE